MARNKIEKLRQGGDTVTEFWNTFHLLSTDANMDDGTLQGCFIKGMSGELQEAWPRAQTRHNSVEELANWAVEQENRMITIKQIKQSKLPTKSTEIPRSPNRTFWASQEDRGDPMELDATTRWRFNIYGPEYRRRMRENRCLRCANQGHRATNCWRPENMQEGSTWKPAMVQNNQGKGPARARKIETQRDELSGNEESPQ